MKRLATTLLAPALLLAGCDSAATVPDDGARVSVDFGVARAVSAPAGGALAIAGSNGTLTLTELRLVVAEFELDGEDDGAACTGDDCEDFDAGPAFVSVPLDGREVQVAAGPLPPGTYRRLEFEVEDLDDDEQDPAERQRIEETLSRIRAEIPEWPRRASMRVAGTFQPQAGPAVPFRVFVEAEIELRLPLEPPLVVGAADAGRTVAVTLDPAAWFRVGDQVLDLSRYDGRSLELEVRTGFRGRGRG
jgi:hypothetical protein